MKSTALSSLCVRKGRGTGSCGNSPKIFVFFPFISEIHQKFLIDRVKEKLLEWGCLPEHCAALWDWSVGRWGTFIAVRDPSLLSHGLWLMIAA